MNKHTAILFVLFMLFFNVTVFSQDPIVNEWESVMEQIAVTDEYTDVNWDHELEELTNRLDQPLNLNEVTKEKLLIFPFLTELQIEDLLAYLYINGPMQSVYELQLVESMDKQSIELLIPYVCVKPVEKSPTFPSLKNILTKGRHELITRIDIPFYKRKGYEDSYLGPSVYHSTRYGFRYKDHVYAGITAEKDAGEPFLALHNTKGYDHYSFYFLLKDIRRIKTLALGNYRLSFGQGLVMSNDFIMGKSTSLYTLGNRAEGIKKHASTDEFNYQQGAAVAVNWKKICLSAFYSHRSLDGIVKEEQITSINKSGLHRTQKEAERSNLFALQLMGGNVAYTTNRLKMGVTGIYYFFDKPYEPALREYAKYNIRGNHFYNLGVDYKYRWNRFLLSGEAAIGKSGGYALLNTLSYSKANNYTVSLVHRLYTHDYWAMYASSFSEGGHVQNENGWYLAVEANPFRYWKYFVSLDFFSFPWLKYGIDRASSGVDVQFQSTYAPSSRLSMFIRYRYKKKDKNYTNEEKVKSVLPLHQHRLKYQFNYKANAFLAFKSVADYTHLHQPGVQGSEGYQLAQVCTYAFRKWPLKCELQGSWFHTDDYFSRVYSYEKGMMYSFSVPSYYGIGTRIAFHMKYDVSQRLMIMAKVGQTRYHDRDEIGSGLDLIRGNKKADAQLQVRYKL